MHWLNERNINNHHFYSELHNTYAYNSIHINTAYTLTKRQNNKGAKIYSCIKKHNNK